MLHAMGFSHEHSRSDRDDFVKVNFANIQTGNQFLLRLLNRQAWHQGGEIDTDLSPILVAVTKLALRRVVGI